MLDFGGSIEVFTTSPQSKDFMPTEYLRRAMEMASWSDDAGCAGMLIYTDNGIVDPWLVASVMLQRTRRLCPLVAVQPIYMHPYAAAKMVASLAFMHQRRVCLNMLAGGFRNDLVALGDETPHDDRYVRTIEDSRIVRELLETERPVTREGRYYQVRGLCMTPSLPSELFPDLLISGSSQAGRAAAVAIGATAVEYPKPSGVGEDPFPAECAAAYGLGSLPVQRPRRRGGSPLGVFRRIAGAASRRHGNADKRFRLAPTTLAAGPGNSGAEESLLALAFRELPHVLPLSRRKLRHRIGEVARYLHLGCSCFILDIPTEPGDLDRQALCSAGRWRKLKWRLRGAGDRGVNRAVSGEEAGCAFANEDILWGAMEGNGYCLQHHQTAEVLETRLNGQERTEWL